MCLILKSIDNFVLKSSFKYKNHSSIIGIGEVCEIKSFCFRRNVKVNLDLDDTEACQALNISFNPLIPGGNKKVTLT